jgi:hypothetical protein
MSALGVKHWRSKDTALLRRPLQAMPLRNILTRLQLALISCAVFEEWRNRVRGASVFWLKYR